MGRNNTCNHLEHTHQQIMNNLRDPTMYHPRWVKQRGLFPENTSWDELKEGRKRYPISTLSELSNIVSSRLVEFSREEKRRLDIYPPPVHQRKPSNAIDQRPVKDVVLITIAATPENNQTRL